jgi:hypothetical protein
MRFKFLLFLILLIFPEMASAYYVWHPCCARLSLAGWWASVDYMLLWRKERFYPPLVTTNPTAPPILGDPGTTILFGDENLGKAPKAAIRADIGIWLTRCLGFGGGFFALKDSNIKFQEEGGANGLPILGRPFFDTSVQMQTAFIFSYPSPLTVGKIDIDTSNHLWGYDIYAKRRYLASPCFKFDLIAGFVSSQIIDNININTRQVIETTEIFVHDKFNCTNNYYAGLVGAISEWRSKNWAISLSGKVGLGNMVKTVEIKGSETAITGTSRETIPTGLLAQPSNIGENKAHKFEIVPQVNANLQLRIWGPLWLTAGYTYMYWPAVVLAGEQIDLNVNPTQLPGPIVGTPSPLPHQHNKSFWMQGLTAGFYIFF